MREYKAVVPYYFLVWYNRKHIDVIVILAVVPYYFLVWYNYNLRSGENWIAVVPYYFLVWYNKIGLLKKNL